MEKLLKQESSLEEQQRLVESILAPLGTSLRHYTPSTRERVLKAAKEWLEMREERDLEELTPRTKCNRPEKRRCGVSDILHEILEEVRRAMKKFPTWPTDPIHALAVVGEEFGELQKEVLQMAYEPHKTDHEKIRSEAIQLAAMALRFLYSLDFYHYSQSSQHTKLGELK